jgi:hypothetical protein
MCSSSPKTDLRAVIEANIRPWNSFWAWRDKPIGEHGAAAEILGRVGVQVMGLVSRPPNEDPPDCEGTLDHQWSGIEVTELVHRKALERSIKAIKERNACREPERPGVYFEWDRATFIDVVRKLIDAKDAVKLKGGPYKRYVLVIHTNEFTLSRIAVSEFLQGAKFRARQITDVFLGLSYEPGFGIPTFRLDLSA